MDTPGLVHDRRPIPTHLREITRPQAGTGELVDAVGLCATHHLLQRALGGSALISRAEPFGWFFELVAQNPGEPV